MRLRIRVRMWMFVDVDIGIIFHDNDDDGKIGLGCNLEAIFLSMLTYSNYLLTEYNICRDSDA